MTGAKRDGRLARRWFWTLFVLAVLSMGVLYGAAQSRPGMLTGATVLVSSLVLVAASLQAARIRFVLAGGRAGGVGPTRQILRRLKLRAQPNTGRRSSSRRLDP